MSSTASTPPKLRTLLRLFLPVFQFLQHESSSQVVTHAQSTFPQPRWFPRQHRGFIIHHAIFLFHSTPFNASIQLHISPTASTSGGAVSTMLSGVCVLCDVAPFAADTVFCSSYHNGHVCICLPLPIAFLCCCCNLCPTLDHGTNKLRVEVTFFRPQFLIRISFVRCSV